MSGIGGHDLESQGCRLVRVVPYLVNRIGREVQRVAFEQFEPVVGLGEVNVHLPFQGEYYLLARVNQIVAALTWQQIDRTAS